MSKIRVAIVDDHPMVRSGLAGLIKSDEGLEWVGEAANGKQAIALCEKTQPQVVLMDLAMPVMDGAAATQIIREANPNIQVIVLTSFYEPALVHNAIRAGAIGYLLKTATATEIVQAIHAAQARQRTLAPEATEALIEALQNPPLGTDLTERELEVLTRMSQGLSNAEIAKALEVSLPTVKFHVSNILSKLGVNSRTEAILLALKHKLTSS